MIDSDNSADTPWSAVYESAEVSNYKNGLDLRSEMNLLISYLLIFLFRPQQYLKLLLITTPEYSNFLFVRLSARRKYSCHYCPKKRFDSAGRITAPCL